MALSPPHSILFVRGFLQTLPAFGPQQLSVYCPDGFADERGGALDSLLLCEAHSGGLQLAIRVLVGLLRHRDAHQPVW